MKTFGEVISELLKELGLTRKALAAPIKKKDGIANSWRLRTPAIVSS
jgi:hypothetical protein